MTSQQRKGELTYDIARIIGCTPNDLSEGCDEKECAAEGGTCISEELGYGAAVKIIARVKQEASPSMTFAQFHNALRILTSVDYDELVAAGVESIDGRWGSFQADPFRWFIKASDVDAAKVWAIIEARQSRRAA